MREIFPYYLKGDVLLVLGSLVLHTEDLGLKAGQLVLQMDK